jgi:hypothetical protein
LLENNPKVAIINNVKRTKKSSAKAKAAAARSVKYKYLAAVSAAATVVVAYQLYRLLGWGDIPFGVSDSSLSWDPFSFMVPLALVCTATLFVTVFSLVKNKSLALLVSTMGSMLLFVGIVVAAFKHALTF